jgi:hypothetical protein
VEERTRRDEPRNLASFTLAECKQLYTQKYTRIAASSIIKAAE